MIEPDAGRYGHLLVRKDGVLCTQCLQLVPVHPGDGTPLPSFLLALEGLMKGHPPGARHCELRDG